MSLFSEEKHKNDQPRGFPWWTLVIAFGLGILVTLVLLLPARQQESATAEPIPLVNDEALYLTATALVQQVTQTAEVVRGTAEAHEENFLATATALVVQATEQAAKAQEGFAVNDVLATVTAIVAQGTQQADSAQGEGLDPLLLTATAIIVQATQTATR